MSVIRFGPLDHCSILITDLANARRFYGDVLGLKEIAKPKTFDFVVIWYDLGGGQTLHLLQKPQPDTSSPRHFALAVGDARAARDQIRAHGIAIDETTPIPHCDRFFVHDPDGNRIECIQWLEPYDPARSGAARLD
jgi:catechol 2,3-dioxygenase-like lactoylglutathione lyase family enzyme